MLINNHQVVDRGNRPNLDQRVGLQVYFINDGAYVDPYEISSVQLFTQSDTLTPNTILGSENLVSSLPLMTFGASGATLTSDSNFDASNYEPGTTASGIYKISTGNYVVVLDQILALSGYDTTNDTEVAASSLSAVDDYVDAWTVKLSASSKYQVILNNFRLHEDTFFAFTEPLMLTTTNKLSNKHVRLGEKIDLKVFTDITLQNRNMDKSIQNIFKDSVVSAATITVKKVNQDPTYDGPFTVVSGATMDVTSDNTLVYNWDTTAITCGDTFGSITGTYSVQVTYSVLNQTIISPMFYLTLS